MYFKQFYLDCLAHGSYLIGSGGQGAVIDPQRDVDQYIDEAARAGLAINYIIETHLHADFVSGHTELSKRTGAQIVFGQKSDVVFPHLSVKDGDILTLGTVILSILETPGHTPESICILARDAANQEPAKLFSGDTLFVGDVGRPDLVASKGFSSREMAGMLYDSIHEKLLKLPDEVEIFPAHGAGSLCGKHLSHERSSTMGQQRRINYALRPMPRDGFIEMLIADQSEIPGYFIKDVEINRLGALPLDALISPPPLTANEVAKEIQRGALLLDVRNAVEYTTGHIERSLNIGLNGQFASWAGILVQMGTPIILLANDQNEVDEAVLKLSRIGIETVAGYLQRGVSGWNGVGFKTVQTNEISVDGLKSAIDRKDELLVLDVRRPSEFAEGHIPSAINMPLAEISKHISELPSGWPLAIVCAGGYRSSMASSVFERCGINHVTNVLGGTAAWKNAGYELESSVIEKTFH